MTTMSSEYRKAYYQKNRERILARQREFNHRYYRDVLKERYRLVRREVLKHYGGRCECCGESRFEFLTIDHIDGGGRRHRKEVGVDVTPWLKNNGYPDGFRVLCWNCNCAKPKYGYCPHEYAKSLEAV